MATREVSDGTRTIERWTNEGAQPGYYSGTPLVLQRALSAAEAALLAAHDTAAASSSNETTIRAQALAALTTNRTYTALASPSTAQNTAQIKALSQQHNAIIRMLLGLFDGTN